VYSGLETYDNRGNIVNDLADSYTLSPDGKTYTFTLKNNLFWQDGKPLTADDVLFTIKTIQNSDYKSPLRANWIDVQTQKLTDTSFSLILKQPYNSFLENCTLKIIPQHIWQNISPENFILSLYNLQPIGSGPFAFGGLTQTKTGFIESMQLNSNRRYYGQASYIAGITFKFFEKNEDVIAAAKQGDIDGFAQGSTDTNLADVQNNISGNWGKNQTFTNYSFLLPRYFAVFLNTQKPSLFSDPNIRKAMTLAIDKTQLIKDVKLLTHTNVSAVDSPILPNFFNYQAPSNIYTFDTTKAEALLDAAGFKADANGVRSKAITKKPSFQFKSYLKVGSAGSEVTQLQACLTKLGDPFKTIIASETPGKYTTLTESAVTEFQKKYLPDAKPTGETGAGTRQELNTLCASPTENSTPLSFTLVTINQPQLTSVANALKKYWEAIGFTVTVNDVSLTDLKPIIKNRSYDALLYGETLGMQPDLYPFWYSAQKQDPGLNLSQYENKDVDKLLQAARQAQDPAIKEQNLEQLQNIILADAPAIFLYNPDYTYFVSSNVKGIDTHKIADPAKRFENIINWYIDT
ncbi:MAG: ABC transporter substrate-binding protein, partial [Candidatus Paceibacterales bacterium]